MSCLFTSFGEINEPSSRAFWGDFDEEAELQEEEPGLEWDSHTTPKPIPVDLLVLIEGFSVEEFVEQILLKDSQEICRIKNQDISLHKLNNESKIIGILKENLVNSGEVANMLLPFCNMAKHVVTITIQPKVEYKSENITAAVKDEITFVRAVNPGLKTIQQLEVPNFIVGVCAAIYSYRDMKNLSVNAYIAFTDKPELDALSTAPMLKLLQGIGVKCADLFIPKQKDQSHLYM